jgi:hypothetical protein
VLAVENDSAAIAYAELEQELWERIEPLPDAAKYANGRQLGCYVAFCEYS